MDVKNSNKRKLVSLQMNSKKPKITSLKLYFPTQSQFLDSCLSQKFSLPIPIMKYIWENPSLPEGYQKLIKCCKLFFIKNPILVIENLEYNFYTGWQYCTYNECWGRYCEQNHKKMDMDMLDGQRLWISKSVFISPYQKPDLISTFIPKIHRYDVNILEFSGQQLSYNELKFLSTGVLECHLFCNTVKYENGQEVPLENIIKLFSAAKKVTINFAFMPSNASCRSYDDFVSACNTVEDIKLLYIPNVFNVPTFYQHLKRSKNRSFIKILSVDENTQHLNQIIDQILDTKSFDFVPPVIEYFRHNRIKLSKMEEIQENEAAKYY